MSLSLFLPARTSDPIVELRQIFGNVLVPQFPLIQPRQYLPYSKLQALAML
jgi:hypothetical protein